MDEFWNVKLKHAGVSYTYKYKDTEKIYFLTGFEHLMHKMSYEYCSNEEKNKLILALPFVKSAFQMLTCKLLNCAR